VPIIHLDVYRLDTLQEASDLGLDEADNCVTFIEWGDAMQPLLPADHLEIDFRSSEPDGEAGDDDEVRKIVMRPRGADWRRRIVGLAVDCAPWRPNGPPELDMLEL
jgi:tRNA A37 threonylcarbamoyladenosine biosynthesis protein TsaE